MYDFGASGAHDMAKKNVARTVKFSDEELEEFKRAYYERFEGCAPVSDSALLRYMAIRGCEALKADMATLEAFRKEK